MDGHHARLQRVERSLHRSQVAAGRHHRGPRIRGIHGRCAGFEHDEREPGETTTEQRTVPPREPIRDDRIAQPRDRDNPAASLARDRGAERGTVRGRERANFLVGKLVEEARRDGVYIPRSLTTAYKNTIPPEKEEPFPGNRDVEHKIRSAIRWNAVAIILRANKESSELGGHIASFQSLATLYDIGFGHFWHAPTEEHGGDL